jgi:glutamate-1-semialdehyde aminotransferase
LRAAVAREGDAIAAILTEPVMCNTGCILPEPGYLQAMREIADSRGIVLIYDEVITGFRLGFGGAQGTSVRHSTRSLGVRQGAGRRLSRWPRSAAGATS